MQEKREADVTRGQLLTLATLGLAIAIVAAGTIAGGIYFSIPFDLELAGQTFPAAQAFSGKAAFVAGIMIGAAAVLATALVRFQQMITSSIVRRELSKYEFCEQQIRETFGPQAADEWLNRVAIKAGRENYRVGGIF
jgi:hypothetical protein